MGCGDGIFFPPCGTLWLDQTGLPCLVQTGDPDPIMCNGEIGATKDRKNVQCFVNRAVGVRPTWRSTWDCFMTFIFQQVHERRKRHERKISQESLLFARKGHAQNDRHHFFVLWKWGRDICVIWSSMSLHPPPWENKRWTYRGPDLAMRVKDWQWSWAFLL